MLTTFGHGSIKHRQDSPEEGTIKNINSRSMSQQSQINGANGAGGVDGISERTRAKWAASSPEEIATHLPPMLDLTTENITENVMQINSMCENPRMRYLITKLVKASHDYVRDVGLQFDEWKQAWQFLTRVSLMLVCFGIL